MTHEAIYEFSTSRTHQYRTGVATAVCKPCSCRQYHGRGLRDVQTTSLSLFAPGASSAAAAADSRAQDRVHRQVAARYCRSSATVCATTRSVSQLHSRASTASLSTTGRSQWLIVSLGLVKSLWNTILIDCWLPNWHKSTTRWYRKRSGTRVPPLRRGAGA